MKNKSLSVLFACLLMPISIFGQILESLEVLNIHTYVSAKAGTVDSVKLIMLDEDDDFIIIAAAKYIDGDFKMDLPQTLPSAFMFSPSYPKDFIVNKDVKIATDFFLAAVDADGDYIGTFNCKMGQNSTTTVADLVFLDNEVTISGIDKNKTSYDLSFSKKWNWMFEIKKRVTHWNEETTISTRKPLGPGLRWYLDIFPHNQNIAKALRNGKYLKKITSVTIPDGMQIIGKRAFEGCTELTSITIPNSVQHIESDAFAGCSNLKTIIIPHGVTIISNSAFRNCKNLTSITLPNSLIAIDGSVFRGCSSLKEITIPNSVKYIEEGAFYGCSSLTSITIPNSVTTIRDRAFQNCSNLTSITIPNTVTSIGKNIFEGCNSLKGNTYGQNQGQTQESSCLRFDKTIYDFGEIEYNRDNLLTGYINVTNKGKATVYIIDISTTTGKLQPYISDGKNGWVRPMIDSTTGKSTGDPKVGILPNETFKIQIKLDSPVLGEFKKPIMITSEESGKKNKNILNVVCKVVEPKK